MVWDRRTGQPYANAIVWQDTRTAELTGELAADERGDLIRQRTGLPPATYFSGGKLPWILTEVDGLRAAAESGRALFGTIDTWLLWNLTGGTDGGVHLTDVTNAGRTMLMDLGGSTGTTTSSRSSACLGPCCPRSVPSSDPTLFGHARLAFGGEVAIGGVLGDQHAAMVGQVCLAPGDAKNTYGTGNFLLVNTGTEIVRSTHGLLSTVCYQFGTEPALYALEGSIAVTGSAVQWLRDQLGVVSGRRGGRRAGRVGDRRRRDVLRAGLLGSVRALLAVRRAGRDGRPLPIPHGRPSGPGHPGGHLLPELRRGRGHARPTAASSSPRSRSTAG